MLSQAIVPECSELFDKPVHMLFCAEQDGRATLPFQHPMVHWTVSLGASQSVGTAERVQPEAIVLKTRETELWAAQLCRSLVDALGDRAPLIFAWAPDGTGDVRQLLEAGAVDVLEGPIRRTEIMRLWAHLRRRLSASQQARLLRFGDLTLDLDALKAKRNGRTIALPTLQRRLLQIMLEQPQHVFTREELEERLWGGKPVDGANLRTCMRRLRQALNGPGERELISNVRRIGYSLDAD